MTRSNTGGATRSASRRVGSDSRKKRPTPRATSADPTGPVRLAAECLIHDAPALKQQLLARMEDSGTVVLDASAVQRIDTAALQLIGAFVRDRAGRGLGIRWHAASPAFAAAARLLGLEGLLQMPAVSSPSDGGLG